MKIMKELLIDMTIDQEGLAYDYYNKPGKCGCGNIIGYGESHGIYFTALVKTFHKKRNGHFAIRKYCKSCYMDMKEALRKRGWKLK